MLSSIFISITVNLRDRLWRRSDKAWRDIPREMVANSFLKCGITNSLDGSEDDFIFDTSSDDESIESESDFEGF